MIDWHSHILPGIDDGSRNVRESLLMLKLLKEQGIETVVATPHFYADINSVESFLIKRDKSYEALNEKLKGNWPKILLGAEVCYYPGISKLNDLKKLCIQGTDLLLLEMPMAKWTQHTVNEVVELACSGAVTVVIAHVDRYMKYQNDTVIRKMCEAGILMQMNASFFESFLNRKKAFRLLSSGTIRFIGSDCHNVNSRKPMIGEAYMHIRKKFGDDFISRINEFGYSIFY